MFAFINMEDWSLRFVDKKRILDGEEVYLLPDRLLNCTMPVSSKDTIKKVHKIVTKVAEEFGQNPTQAICQAKAVLLEAGQKSERIEPAEVGRKVFEHHSGMRDSYMEQIEHASLPKVTEVDRDYAVRTNKSHKIKTDSEHFKSTISAQKGGDHHGWTVRQSAISCVRCVRSVRISSLRLTAV